MPFPRRIRRPDSPTPVPVSSSTTQQASTSGTQNTTAELIYTYLHSFAALRRWTFEELVNAYPPSPDRDAIIQAGNHTATVAGYRALVERHYYILEGHVYRRTHPFPMNGSI